MVAEELNFRRAADRLGIDHSALSRRIRDLEHRIGFPVFERSTREVRLTEAGRVFLEENQSMLRGLQRSVENARLVADGMSGLIRIGYMSFAASQTLPSLIARFRSVRPDVRIQLTYLKSHAQKEALSRGDIDIGIMIGPWPNDAFETTTLSIDPLCVFFARNWTMARRKTIDAASLARQPLIMGTLEQWDLYRWQVEDMLLKKGIVPNVLLEASSISGILGLVQRGLGVTIFPLVIAKTCPPAISHRVLEDCNVSIETIGVAPQRPTPIVREFVSIMREASRREEV